VTEYRPLEGVRVLDLSRLIIGGLATRQLADLGAEVVKVEDPITGDYLRTIPPFVDGYGVWHQLLNRNKKSIALDLSAAKDRATLMRLIDAADVVVEVSRPGGLQRLDIDFALCRARKPSLIVCSISGFGQTGEWAQLPAHGMNIDSLGGAVLTREVNGGELRFMQLAFTGLGQEGGAMNAALAVLGALVGVRRNGEGAWIDVSCWDALIDMNRAAIAFQAATNRTVQSETEFMWGSMHRIYRTCDDKSVFIAVIEKKFWDRFCEALGRPDLLDRWHSEGDVDYGDPELAQELEPIFASRSAAAWTDFFVENELPGSPLLTLGEAMASPHFQTRGMLEIIDGLPAANIAGPIRWIDKGTERPGSHPSPPPHIGADTDEVLRTWLQVVPNPAAS
jgi:alpha-methylacyl-CoA racemase